MQVVETGGATISAAYINAPGTTEITASGLQRVRIFCNRNWSAIFNRTSEVEPAAELFCRRFC